MFDPNPPDRIAFKGDLSFEVRFFYDGERMGGLSLPGEFSGHFDPHGTYLEEVTVDTSTY